MKFKLLLSVLLVSSLLVGCGNNSQSTKGDNVVEESKGINENMFIGSWERGQLKNGDSNAATSKFFYELTFYDDGIVEWGAKKSDDYANWGIVNGDMLKFEYNDTLNSSYSGIDRYTVKDISENGFTLVDENGVEAVYQKKGSKISETSEGSINPDYVSTLSAFDLSDDYFDYSWTNLETETFAIKSDEDLKILIYSYDGDVVKECMVYSVFDYSNYSASKKKEDEAEYRSMYEADREKYEQVHFDYPSENMFVISRLIKMYPIAEDDDSKFRNGDHYSIEKVIDYYTNEMGYLYIQR